MSRIDAATRPATAEESTPRTTRHPVMPHRGMAAATAAMAVAAYAGAVGMIGGGLRFTPAIEARLPWHSLPLAGTALLVAVALPMTVAAWLTWRGHRRGPDAAVAAGAAVLVWLIVEIAFIRAYSWMQPTCAVYGSFVAALGVRARRN